MNGLLAIVLLVSTLHGGRGFILVPSTETIPPSEVSLIAATTGRSPQTWALDLGAFEGLEVGVARRKEGGRWRTAVNAKLTMRLRSRKFEALSAGMRDVSAQTRWGKQWYVVASPRIGGSRLRLDFGLMGDEEKTGLVGGAEWTVSWTTSLLLEYERGRVNWGIRVVLPVLGLYAQWAWLGVEGNPEQVVSVGWASGL